MKDQVISMSGFANRDVVIDGALIQELFACPGDLDKVLERLQLGETPAELLERLSHPYDDNYNVPPAVRGLGGFGTLLFLRAYAGRFAQKNGETKVINPEFRTKVSGKICDYVFLPDPVDPYQGSGHLSVEVLEETFQTNQDLIDCKPNKATFHHWDIEVCKYSVFERNNKDFPDNPYPDLPNVMFPAPALDPNDSRSIWCRCLDHKLYAEGKDIKIEQVYRQVTNYPSNSSDEDFNLLDKDDPMINALYYESTPDSCVDIMFKGYPPLVNLPEQREYCLGRCKDPAIVNTGV
jgi:hypothetical protein